MEKEFISLTMAILNFADYIEAAPMTFVLTDSQPVLWALRHQEGSLKLSRWLLKIFELPVNLILTHIEGEKNKIADFLSRIYWVPEGKNKEKDELGPKSHHSKF